MKNNKLLFISPVFPKSSKSSGLAMRAYATLYLLSKDYQIDLLVLNSSNISIEHSEVSLLCNSITLTPRKKRNIFKAILFRLLPSIYKIIYLKPIKWYSSPFKEIEVHAKHLLNKHFDIIHAFRLDVSDVVNLIKKRQSTALQFLDLDDIDSIANTRIAECYVKRGRYLLAARYYCMAKQYEKMEIEYLNKYDRVFVCSSIDANKLKKQYQISVVDIMPNVVYLPNLNQRISDEKIINILFVGNFNYFPNLDGILFFCKEVLPIISKKTMINFHLNIVGKGLSRFDYLRLSAIAKVSILGFVEDLSYIYSQSHLAVVPIRAGGGTRIKLLEAFSYKLPVVSTAMGAEGIMVKHQQNVLLANTKEEFANSCIILMKSKDNRDFLAQHAYELVKTQYQIRETSE